VTDLGEEGGIGQYVPQWRKERSEKTNIGGVCQGMSKRDQVEDETGEEVLLLVGGLESAIKHLGGKKGGLH